MEKVWYTINLEPAANTHYVIGDFNFALFTVTVEDFQTTEWVA